jgi:small subunit ribosomal protein S1
MITDNNEVNSMTDIMNNSDYSLKNIKVGEVVKGRIISVTENEAIVNIGYMSDAVLPKTEVIQDSETNLDDMLKRDDEINVYILDMNDGEGNVLVSKKAADTIKAWDELEQHFKNNSTFDVKLAEIVKGGIVAYVKCIRAFIPASQLSLYYVKDLSEFVGKTLSVKIIEFDRDKARLVLSRKEVEKGEQEIKKENLLKVIKPGEKIEGVVRRLTKFGAFVDLGGIDGLIHISELSWERVNDPSEVVSIGDNVEVYVLSVDKENDKISLSLKGVKSNPWNSVEEKYSMGDVIEGVVSKVLNFGAFVQLEPGIEGLIHISEISQEHISKPSDVLKMGDKVKVKILDINKEQKKISLSIKDASEKSKKEFKKYMDTDQSGVTLGDLFRDKLKDFKFD